MTSILTNAARELIYSHFTTQWAGTTPLFYDGDGQKPPTEGPAWARLTVRHNTSAQETLGPTGARKFQRGGSVFVSIFTPGNQGTKEGDALALRARNALEGVTLSSAVRLYNAVQREIGPDGFWYQMVVEARFEYDEIK